MPDDSPVRGDRFRLWIALAVALVLVFLSVNFFEQFSSALASQDLEQLLKRPPPVAGPPVAGPPVLADEDKLLEIKKLVC